MARLASRSFPGTMQEQKLRPGEKIDMPVFFYVDPEFATDPRMRKVNHLTLSYTFFKVDLGNESCLTIAVCSMCCVRVTVIHLSSTLHVADDVCASEVSLASPSRCCMRHPLFLALSCRYGGKIFNHFWTMQVSDQTVEEDAAAEPLGGDSLGAAQDPGGIIVPAAAGV